ncbi:MAG: PAS domain S-box protein [Solirubrobacteraceae bacterium]
MAELDVNAVLAVVVRELPGASVVAFDDRTRIVAMAGPDAEELRERCGPLFERVLKGEDHSIEDRPGEDSERRRIDIGPVRDANGRVVGGVCLMHRVSDVDLLREELDQQRQLLELAHDAIIVRDPRYSSITYWNREAQEIYGYAGDEVYGRVTHELLATEFPDSREAVDDAPMRYERWDGQLRHRRKDGRQIIVSSRQALVRDADGNPVAVIELNSDITDRVKGEQALRDAERQFRGLMESAPDAMVILDDEGSIVFVNVRAEELFGYSRPEMIGQDVDMLLPSEFRERLFSQRMDFVTDTNAPDLGAGVDVLARRRDGSEFLADMSLSPLQTDTGLLISTSIRDISKQLLRQLEQALVPRMKLDERWRLAWRYRPTVNTMLLGGDFIGVAERSDGSLSLLIGDVTGHGPAAAGTGAMLRAAWLGAVQANVALESIPSMLDRLLVDQADREASKMATVCLVEVDPGGQKLQIVRAGHDSPLLITRESVTALNRVHGPALGLGAPSTWPVRDVDVPAEAAIMLFTDGLTERRPLRRRGRLGFDELVPQIDAPMLLDGPPDEAIDRMLVELFPQGTDALEDDLAVILLSLDGT